MTLIPAALARPLAPLTRPVALLAGPAVRLFLTSATILFVELLLIRWVPANVVYVGYFSNFLLMASFLGIGGGHPVRARPAADPDLAVRAAPVRGRAARDPGPAQRPARDAERASSSGLARAIGGRELPRPAVHRGARHGGHGRAGDPARAAPDVDAAAAGLRDRHHRLDGRHPGVHAAVGRRHDAVRLVRRRGGPGPPARRSAPASAAGRCVAARRWSASRHRSHADAQRRHLVALLPHHEYQGGGVSCAQRQRHPPPGELHRRPAEGASSTSRSTSWFPDRHTGGSSSWGPAAARTPRSQLAHGADTSTPSRSTRSSRRSASRDHPDQPYSDPRVHRYVERRPGVPAHTRQASTTWSIFALPDSLTLVSTSANLRLESFLFTEQAFASVRDHLAPDGIFVLYNYYREPWLVQKMAGDAPDAASAASRSSGSTPSSATRRDPGGRAGHRGTERRTAARRPRRHDPDRGDAASKPATDDWPFLYLTDAVRSRRSTSSRWASCCCGRCCSSLAAPGGAGRRSGASARTSSCSAWRSCCSRRAAS